MLELKTIKKSYTVANQSVEALKGISLCFRNSEFVSVLGPSGCGKTTLLNIIGGLDRYSSGELLIDGVPTQSYKDSDWDYYRNHSIGFVFQSYNLIPHQTALSNVELALTLAGVSKSERRRRAKEALEMVGLGDQLDKKPNQMSGGQMQRIAIARALVNDPKILLADEPTGALDSETSLQVMELMREIAKDRLVIMVTHNPELAEKYSTRIIRLLDGRIVNDSNPCPAENEAVKPQKHRRTGMSFFTALSLSLNNLMTKKARTFLTAFAGSIGIIGIALILSLSNGISDFISRVEEDTLSSYPLTIMHQTVDYSDLLEDMMGKGEAIESQSDDKVYSMNVMFEMMDAMMSDVSTNDTASFKQFLEAPENGIGELVSDIKYTYETEMYIYSQTASGGYVQSNPNNMFESMGGSTSFMGMNSNDYSAFGLTSTTTGLTVFNELINNNELLSLQYDCIAGRMPEAYNEVVLFVTKNNSINDMALYSLGIKDRAELMRIFGNVMQGKPADTEVTEYTFDELLGHKFVLVPNTMFYQKQADGTWLDVRSDSKLLNSVIENGVELKVVGILRPSDEAVAANATNVVGYTNELTKYLLNTISESEIVQEQFANPDIDVFTGMEFTSDSLTGVNSYNGNLALLGYSDSDIPYSINIYPKDFDSKEQLTAKIEAYNQKMALEQPDSEIAYTDYIDLLMSSVNTIIDAISYVLIAFVAISLVVSSIMIGVITYISVLERTKEIGILRAIGASKSDIARVFNAETLIVGFTSGAIGITISALATIPINALIKHLTDISNIAKLPVSGAIILVLISMALTFIAGLIPANIAKRKDPVVALRSE